MSRFANSALTALAAVALAFGSIGAIVTVPPAQASAALPLPLPALA
jgi:hypothetical protein